MQKRANRVLWIAMILGVPIVCGFALNESSGAAGSITAAATLVGLASTLIVRGLFNE